MSVKKKHFRGGLTLIELMITLLAAIVLVIGISGMLAAGHKNFNHMFARTTSQVVRNSYEVRSIFDNTVRQSVIYDNQVQTSSSDITVYYFSDPGDLTTLDDDPDRYAMFYLSGTDLKLQRGVTSWPPSAPSPGSGDTIIASNVTFAEFTIKGASIRMSLTIDDKDDATVKNKLRKAKIEVTTTAIRHNRKPDE